MKQKIEIRPYPPKECGLKVFSCAIPSEFSSKNDVIDHILSMLREKKFLDTDDEVWARLCLDEVLVNAIKHGNKHDKNKKVNISLYTDNKKEWAVRVEDEGEGFSEDNVPDIENEASLGLDHGRGILLLHSYMDEIWYYDKGNRVQLKKIKKSHFQKIVHNILTFLNFK